MTGNQETRNGKMKINEKIDMSDCKSKQHQSKMSDKN